MLKNTNASDTKVANVRDLKFEMEYRTKLQNICNKIDTVSNIDEILVDLKDEITKLFEAERLTVYVVDGKKRELVSRFKSGDEISEIRIPISPNSIAGYSALKRKLVNIKNVYNEKDCKEKYHPSQKQYDKLVREYGPEDFEKNVKIPYTDDLTLYQPVGCETCNNTGYKGRMGIHEFLMGTDEQKRLIQNCAKMEELRNHAVTDGMTTLKQDGIEKIFAGHSDLIQVRKVCI